jgi:protein-disulfide isomerase
VSAGPITRRTLVALALALPSARAAFAAAFDVAAPQADDMALGSPMARVTVIEYASAGCPHCANWANDVFPAFKARYIDTGKARFVLREVITGQPTVATAGFMLARCAPAEKYFDVVDRVFARQADIFEGKVSAGDALGAVANSVGMSDEAFEACLTDQANLDAVNARSERHATQDGVDTTPTFFVGAKRLDGEQTLDRLAAAIAAAGKARGRR